MVVDASGIFMSQRTYPRLALIATEIGWDSLTVNAPAMDTMKIPFRLTESDAVRVRVWNDVVEAVSTGAGAEEWFSRFLGVSCRLVYMPDDVRRPVDPKYAIADNIVSFADAFPLLLISQPSLDDLNARLALPLPMNRFRPSLVVTGCDPYAEDGWHKIRVGPVTLRVVKPCSRCATTTVDQQTGISAKEPLATLSLYRSVNGKVMFGQNVIPTSTGILRLGDSVEVID